MEQKALRKTMWEEAGKAGLALGIVSTAYLFITQFLTKVELPALVSMVVIVSLWTGKFAGCIWLMMFFMKRFTSIDDKIDNNTTFRFGFAAALLSAIVYAAASFANTAFISADMINEQINLIMQQMAPAMDSNTMAQMDDLMSKLPQMTFFSNLFYCTIYGGVLSFILSRNIPDRNPFANNTSEEF